LIEGYLSQSEWMIGQYEVIDLMKADAK
jgi:hypothetical protein